MTMASSIKRAVGKFSRIVFNARPKKWADIEYFSESWKDRIRTMAGHIPPGSRLVIDLGCGKMWLKEFLPAGCGYYGVDYTDRGEGSHVYDLNSGAFPDLTADVIFISGCLEYINDYHRLVGEVAKRCKRCIISYCTLENVPDLQERKNLTWVNNLTDSEFTAVFTAKKMKLVEKQPLFTGKNNLYIFDHE